MNCIAIRLYPPIQCYFSRYLLTKLTNSKDVIRVSLGVRYLYWNNCMNFNIFPPFRVDRYDIIHRLRLPDPQCTVYCLVFFQVATVSKIKGKEILKVRNCYVNCFGDCFRCIIKYIFAISEEPKRLQPSIWTIPFYSFK